MKHETQKQIAEMLRAESARYRQLAMELALSVVTVPTGMDGDNRNKTVQDHMLRCQTMLEAARLVEKMEAVV